MPERQKKSKGKHAHHQPRRRGRAGAPVRIAIVGAGRLGTALGRAVDRAGYRVEVVVTKRAAGARKAGRLLGPSVLTLTSRHLGRLTGEQLERLTCCDLILISTPDDVIGVAAAQLSALFKVRPATGFYPRQTRRVALHTSGALSSDILGPLREAGLAIGSLHPLVSVSDPVLGTELLRQAFFCVEGQRAAVQRARSIVRHLGGQSFTIDAGKKALYHAAAVMASGHLVALFDLAMEMLSRCGLSPHRARQVLLPLVKSTVTNLSTTAPAHALTGTFARADLSTVRAHLSAIESQKLGDALAAYLRLGKRSIDLARKAGADDNQLNRVEQLIRKALRGL
jgi:predicted short-subunit dehydrogenase-like oxidoreductase (DUF2520 family)